MTAARQVIEMPAAGLLGRARSRAGALGAGVYAALLSFTVLALVGSIGLVARQPWVFPSLGATVLLFFDAPHSPAARPRNTLVGHLVGITVGACCMVPFHLAGLPPAPVAGLTSGRVVAGALSVAVTALVLALLRNPHPPAGASTLIVSLGIIGGAGGLAVMVAAVLLVTAVGWGLNVALGVRGIPRSRARRRTPRRRRR